jgi:hypothetical protein
MRWGVGPLAWIAPAPLLAALRLRRDRRLVIAFVGVWLVAWIALTLKIVTEPVPPVLALGFGVPLALFHLPAYLVWLRLGSGPGARAT